MYAPRIRLTRVAEGWRDPLDALYDLMSPPPLPDEEEVRLILSKLPPEETVINMTKQPNGEYLPTDFIVPNTRRHRHR